LQTSSDSIGNGEPKWRLDWLKCFVKVWECGLRFFGVYYLYSTCLCHRRGPLISLATVF